MHSVNGQPLNSLSAAMDAYNSLGNARDFNFDVTRRKTNKPLSTKFANQHLIWKDTCSNSPIYCSLS